MEFTCPSGNHGSGSYSVCVYDDMTTWSYHIVPTSCDDGGGGSGGEGPITGPSNPSGGGGGSNPVIITTPTKTLQPWEEVLDCLTGIGLNGEIAWLQENKSGAGQIKDFIQDENGNCIPENNDFVMDAIETILEGGDFDHTNHVVLDSTFEDNNKTKCTYQILTKNINFKELIENFTGEESPNLIFKITPSLQCNSSNDPNACTKKSLNSNGSITIEIDGDYINSNQAPTLLIAETIIHEAIHANLYLAVYNYENGNPINIPDIDDFPSIYEQYRQQEGWQHEFMAGEYTNLIAQILQQVHPYLTDQQYIDSLVGFDFSLEQFYICLAYTGLNGTIGQTEFLSNPENADNYNLSYYDVRANSTKEPNCE